MELTDREWKEFPLTSLVSISHGRRLTKADRITGTIPLMTAGAANQGVAEFVSNCCDQHRNFVSVDMFGNSFYKNYATVGDDNIYFLTSEKMSEAIGLFIATCINQQKEKFDYGKQVREKVLQRFRVLLPVADDGQPDYDFMEQYIKDLMLKKYFQYLV